MFLLNLLEKIVDGNDGEDHIIYKYTLARYYIKIKSGESLSHQNKLKSSAAQGNSQAQIYLGNSELKLYDTTKKLQHMFNAKFYFESSILNGEAVAAYELARLYTRIADAKPSVHMMLFEINEPDECRELAKKYCLESLYLFNLKSQILIELKHFHSDLIEEIKREDNQLKKEIAQKLNNLGYTLESSSSDQGNSKISSVPTSTNLRPLTSNKSQKFKSHDNQSDSNSDSKSEKLVKTAEKSISSERESSTDIVGLIEVKRATRQHLLYRTLIWCLDCDAELSENYRKIQEYKKDQNKELYIYEILSTVEETLYGYIKIYEKIKSFNSEMAKKIQERINEISQMQKKILKEETSFKKLLKNFKDIKNIDEYCENHKNLFYEEKTILSDIKEYIISKSPLDKNKYLLNDLRENTSINNIYSENNKKQALLARMEIYYQAVKLILEHCGYENKKLKKHQDKLQEIYDSKNKEILTKDKIEFKEMIFNPFVNFIKSLNIKKDEKDNITLLIEGEFMVNWLKKIPIIVTLIKFQTKILVQIDIPVISKTEDQFKEFYNVDSIWFKNLSTWQKNLLKSMKKDLKLFTSPSTLRIYPTLPFYMHHGILIFEKGFRENCEVFDLLSVSIRSRSSVIVPYGLYENDFHECLRLTMQNMTQYLTNELSLAILRQKEIGLILSQKNILIPILYQTLLSKTRNEDILGSENTIISMKNEIMSYFEDKTSKESVVLSPIFIDTNYALNDYNEGKFIGKLLANPINNYKGIKNIFHCAINFFQRIESMIPVYTSTVETNNLKKLIEVLLELEIMDESLKGYKKTDSYIFGSIFNDFQVVEPHKQIIILARSIASGLDAYVKLKTDSISHLKDSKNLLLAALENIIVNKMGGIVLSSCRSGKDRNGVLQIYIDACEAYYKIAGKFIPDENSVSLFYELISNLFISGHQQLLASSNAVGCIGLKSLANILPEKIKEFIDKKNKGILEINQKFAICNRPEIQNSITIKINESLKTEMKNSQINFFSQVRINDNQSKNHASNDRTPKEKKQEKRKSMQADKIHYDKKTKKPETQKASSNIKKSKFIPLFEMLESKGIETEKPENERENREIEDTPKGNSTAEEETNVSSAEPSFVKSSGNSSENTIESWVKTEFSYDSNQYQSEKTHDQVVFTALVKNQKIKINNINEREEFKELVPNNFPNFDDSIKRKGLKTKIGNLVILPKEIKIGTAVDDGGCFFDALAQILNASQNVDFYCEKYLRFLCHEFYHQNKELVNEWNSKDYRGIDKGEEYYFVQYTKPELDTNFPQHTPIWGRPHIEGKILCQKLNLPRIIIIEILKNPENNSDIPAFKVITAKEVRDLSEEEGNELIKDSAIPVLCVSQNELHFVPLLKNNGHTNEKVTFELENKDSNIVPQVNDISRINNEKIVEKSGQNFPHKNSNNLKGFILSYFGAKQKSKRFSFTVKQDENTPALHVQLSTAREKLALEEKELKKVLINLKNVLEENLRNLEFEDGEHYEIEFDSKAGMLSITSQNIETLNKIAFVLEDACHWNKNSSQLTQSTEKPENERENREIEDTAEEEISLDENTDREEMASIQFGRFFSREGGYDQEHGERIAGYLEVRDHQSMACMTRSSYAFFKALPARQPVTEIHSTPIVEPLEEDNTQTKSM